MIQIVYAKLLQVIFKLSYLWAKERSCLSPPSPHGLHWTPYGLQWTLSSESPQPILSISYMNGLDWSGVESTWSPLRNFISRKSYWKWTGLQWTPGNLLSSLLSWGTP